MATQELRLSGDPETDAQRIAEYAQEVPDGSSRFRRDLFFELQENYDDYYEVKRALDLAAAKGATLPASAASLAKNVADEPFEDVMESRSRTARIADRSTTANTTTRDFGEWASNPNQSDYPGVDTLAEQYRADRVEQATQAAEERGIIRDITVRDELYGGQAAGEFSPYNTDIQLAADQDDAYRNLAHELGHAIDFATTDNSEDDPGPTFGSERAFEQADDDLVEEAADELSDIWDERGRDKPMMNADYLEDPKELAADFAALAIEDPQRAKKKAPNAQQVFEQAGMLDTMLGAASVGGPGEPREQPDNALGVSEDLSLDENRSRVFDTSAMPEFEEVFR